MPDTGDYGQNNPDQTTHADWTGAFAALPQESPAPDGWRRVQARLPAALPTHARTRWSLWLATAASLALVIGIPLRMLPDAMNRHSGASRNPALVVQKNIEGQTLDPGLRRDDDVVVAAVPGFDAHPVALPSTTTARSRKPRRGQHVDPSQRPIRTAAQPADITRIASSEKPDSAASRATLESLYAKSARLENVLALARDDRISSGTAAALTDTLNAQVASIDAALTQPDVSLQGRTDLWSERIDTLRQLVGIETTQRLYSARGQQYEAALVSID